MDNNKVSGKNKLSKKAILFITLTTVLVIGIITTTVLLVEFVKLSTPSVEVKLREKPYNVIEVSWKHNSANEFLVEYFYELEEFSSNTEIVGVKKIELPRKRGLFKVRVQALANKERKNSKFSKIKELYIEPLALQAPTFNLKKDGDIIFIENFEPSYYETESGASENVPSYQFKDSINANIADLSLNELINKDKPYEIHLPEDWEGESYTFFIRALNYLEIFEKEIEEGELYFWHETSDWFEKTINFDVDE